MVTVIPVQRKSAVLTPSSLACLSQIPTINLTVGCAVGCVYCYAVGYTSYPGDGRIMLYENTLEKLEKELAHKHTKPRAVYFSPSTDIFQPVPEVLELSHRIMQFLLSKDVGIAFLTKGLIPSQTMRLFLDHVDKVQAQVGIITLDEDVVRLFEPNAAGPKVRLEQIETLIKGEVATAARLAPILPGFTDTYDALHRLFAALAKVGVRHAAASVLFLRPGITRSMKKKVSSQGALAEVFKFYANSRRLPVRTEGSSVTALPPEGRQEILDRVGHVAKEHGITLLTCACMNPDIARGSCRIAGRWPAASRLARQERLFRMET
ncbi:MAG: radical SAM protein [Chloroflexi bacterium]|nr:radical SAM protein [Chloroflexota bacterium]